MADLNELRFRFYQTPIEKLFDEIHEQASPRVKVPDALSQELDGYLAQATKYCDFELNDRSERFYRARKHGYEQFERFPARNMGPPPNHLVGVGRAQLAGASLLYLAKSAETAVAEVRPDSGEYITVGLFKLNDGERLRVLDLTRFTWPGTPESHRELETLARLSRNAFSQPVHPGDPKKYQAQAYFVQKVQDLGYDGIGYLSATEEKGRCFAIFDANKFRCYRTQIRQVTSVSVKSEITQFSKAEMQFIAHKKAKQKTKRKSS